MDIKHKVLKELIDRSPNSVRSSLLERVIDAQKEQIQDALKQLEALGLIMSKEMTNNRSGSKIIKYWLTNYNDKPIRDKIIIGDHEGTRLMDGDEILAEDTNDLIQAVADHSRSLESHYTKIMRQEIRRYQRETIVIFGIFVSLFAFILETIKGVELTHQLSFPEAWLQNILLLGPLACIQVLFLALVYAMFFRD